MDPGSVAAREAWLLTMYALSHHPEACPSAFVRESMRDQGQLTERLRGWLSAHGPVDGDAVELGCGVGGHAMLWREACRGSVTLCDLRPAMLSVGRTLNAGRPRTLPWRHMGRHYAPITVQSPPRSLDDVHYIVGDALNPPFPAEHFGLVCALNLLDAIRDPWMLLGQLDALTAPGGLLLLGQPFHYEPHAQHPDGWFNDPDALIDTLRGGLTGLEHLSYDILEAEDGIPWSLPAHDRLVHRYAMHLVLARKRD
jgi:SAM-dependent methyltransferase